MAPTGGRTVSLTRILAPGVRAGMRFRRILTQYSSDRLCSTQRNTNATRQFRVTAALLREAAPGAVYDGLEVLDHERERWVLLRQGEAYEAFRATNLMNLLIIVAFAIYEGGILSHLRRFLGRARPRDTRPGCDGARNPCPR